MYSQCTNVMHVNKSGNIHLSMASVLKTVKPQNSLTESSSVIQHFIRLLLNLARSIYSNTRVVSTVITITSLWDDELGAVFVGRFPIA